MLKSPSMNQKLAYLIFALFTGLFFLIIWPFISSIIFAGFFAAVFYPLHLKISQKIGDTFSAFTVLIITVLGVFLPILAFLTLMVSESINFIQYFQETYPLDQIDTSYQLTLFDYTISLQEILEKVSEFLSTAGKIAFDGATAVANAFLNFGIQFFVFLILFFYFLRDHRIIFQKLVSVLPYNKTQKSRLLEDVKSTSKTVFLGSIIGALVAGFAAYGGFRLTGVAAPLTWAFLAGILSFFPTIGTLFVYAFLILLLGLLSSWTSALILLAYFIAVELILVQNIIRPKFFDDKIQVHPILVFFAIVGGTAVFGNPGILYGPLIVVIFVSLFEFFFEPEPGS